MHALLDGGGREDDDVEARSRRMLFTTTITRAELFYGVQLLPDGQRKDAECQGFRRLWN